MSTSPSYLHNRDCLNANVSFTLSLRFRIVMFFAFSLILNDDISNRNMKNDKNNSTKKDTVLNHSKL